jgi:hypothetical protein
VSEKKPAISFERHKEIAGMLKSMRDQLVSLHVEVGNSRKSKRQRGATAALFRANQKVDLARSELEEVMFADHGDRANIHVYYPRRDA